VFVEVEGTAGVFDGVAAGDAAGHPEAGKEFGGILDGVDVEALLDLGGVGKGGSDVSGAAAAVVVFGLPGAGVGVEWVGLFAWGKFEEPAGVVVVAVADGDGIGGGEVDAEGFCVLLDGHALAGVPEDFVTLVIHPNGEAVLGYEAGASDAVFTKEGEGKHVFFKKPGVRITAGGGAKGERKNGVTEVVGRGV